MQLIKINAKDDFKVIAGTKRSQSATMVLQPASSTGGSDNKHKSSDQWLYVLSGNGEAIVAGQTLKIETGSLLLIEAGETHEIKNNGKEPLKTLNFYCPPEY